MGTRLEKYRNELAKARQKRAEIDEKIKELEAKCMEEENTEEINQENESPSPLEGKIDFDPIPERIDTVRLYSAEETGNWKGEFFNYDGMV